MMFRVSFFIATKDEGGLQKFLSKHFGTEYAISPVEKGGFFESRGYLLEVMIDETKNVYQIETALGGLSNFCKGPLTFKSVGVVKEAEYGRDESIVRRHLNIGAYTPQEIFKETGVDMLKLSKILPSPYNFQSVLNPSWRSLYEEYKMPPRILSSSGRGGVHEVVIDRSYVWRYWTVFSYKRAMLRHKLRKLRRIMLVESAEKAKIAKKAAMQLREEIAAEFGFSKEIGNSIIPFCFALAGSVYRRDAIESSDTDVIFIFDDHFFSPGSIFEMKLQLIIFKKILDLSKKQNIHLSIHTVPLSDFFTTVMEGLDPPALTMFVHSKPLIGESMYYHLKKEVQRWRSYKEFKEKTVAEFSRELSFSEFQYQLLNVCEDPAKNAKIRAETIASLKEKVAKLEKILAKS